MPSTRESAIASSSTQPAPSAPAVQSARAHKFWMAAVLVAAGLQAQGFSLPASAAQAQPTPAYTGGFIVRWKDGTDTKTASNVSNGTSTGTATEETTRMRQVRDATGLTLSVKRRMGGNLQLLAVPSADAADPEATAAKLRLDPRVADVVPDRWLRLHDTIPNDPEYLSAQTYLGAATQLAGAANLPSAWDRTQGNASIVIAVVDTGYLPHPDLASRIVPGYDFIGDNAFSLDNQDGRDNDATDPGDNVPANYTCPGTSTPTTQIVPNTWHGTRVASVIGAQTNNGTNIAGVDWQARIQPVRVSGRCGALLSDTVDGMRWAGGLAVPGVPANPTPARVINISLGGGTCSSAEQSAVNELTAAGVVVVAAAGNSATAVEAPADCAGVIAVTAHVNSGENASYANVGTQVAISAPGGGCGNSKVSNGACTVAQSYIRTLYNNGTTSLGSYNVVDSQGTSFSAPMVSGVASLMLATNGSLSPAQVTSILKSTARPHPANTYCTAASSVGTCGAGLLDAAAALTLAASTVGTGSSAATTTPTPTPAPVTQPTTSSNSGGGGGGAVPLWSGTLLALLGLVAYALPRRRNQA